MRYEMSAQDIGFDHPVDSNLGKPRKSVGGFGELQEDNHPLINLENSKRLAAAGLIVTSNALGGMKPPATDIQINLGGVPKNVAALEIKGGTPSNELFKTPVPEQAPINPSPENPYTTHTNPSHVILHAEPSVKSKNDFVVQESKTELTVIGMSTDSAGMTWYLVAVPGQSALTAWVRGDLVAVPEKQDQVEAPTGPAFAPTADQNSASNAPTGTVDANADNQSSITGTQDIVTAVQKGELVATPDNVGFVLSNSIAPDPESYAAIRNALLSHPELLLPSLPNGEMSSLESNGQSVAYGLFSKEKLDTITINGITKDVYKYKVVAKYKGFVEAALPGLQGQSMVLVFEEKTKDGKSINVISIATPQEVDFTVGTIQGNSVASLNVDDSQTSDHIARIMHEAQGKDVVIEMINNMNPIYGEPTMEEEAKTYSQYEAVLSTGSDFQQENSPSIETLYVPENIVKP